MYSEDDMLPLSGVQHFAFCPRQWALITIEQLWDDNSLTAEGVLLHKNVDNPFNREKNSGKAITLRGLRLESKILGLTGIADAMEIHPHVGAPVSKEELLKSRLYDALPIEYKRGHKKINNCDRLQVTAQAMILEELFDVSISQGAVFYWEEHHREYFDITQALRKEVKCISNEMHKTFHSGIIPKSEKKPCCSKCSLVEKCMPKLSQRSVNSYLLQFIGHKDEETS